MEINSYVKDNINIVEANPGSHIVLGKEDIRMDRECHNLVSKNEEMMLAVLERFKGMGIPASLT